MSGLKDVRQRYDDALSRVGWDHFESLLAVYYRGQGYEVEHCGSGGVGGRFDGGIDLKLRRSGEYALVQCKHWNAKQVPHNEVHQLLGLMLNEDATGGILVTSGEFTSAAKQAATRLGRVRLVDGHELRSMLGPLPERPADRMSKNGVRFTYPVADDLAGRCAGLTPAKRWVLASTIARKASRP